MKTKLFFLVLLFTVATSFSQTTTVPDDNFETYLETHNASAVSVPLGDPLSMGDGIIDNNSVPTAKIDSVTLLSIGGTGVADLTGIEAFTSLLYLYCNNNALTSLDLSSNTLLQILYCDVNSLISLNVTNNTALTHLVCGQNVDLAGIDLTQNINLKELTIGFSSMTSLDVSNNTALTYLSTGYMPIGTLDVTQNTALETLNCTQNNLTVLDLTQNTNLQSLTCTGNSLSALDVSKNLALGYIFARFNNLTNLDLSNNTSLYYIICDHNLLQTLNVKNGNNSIIPNGSFYADYNPNLTCINVDSQAYSNSNWSYIDAQTSFSENCALGVGEFDLTATKVFPNPIRESVHIELNADAIYDLMNLQGQHIQKGNLVSGSSILNLSLLPKGLYFFNIKNDFVSTTRKIIKE